MVAEKRSPPQWEAIVVVANYLDPKTLAQASCVCKSWFISMSSDHLWESICAKRYPSLSALRLADPAVPYRRLYALGRVSDTRRLRKRPQPPLLSMSDVIFAVTVSREDRSPLATVAKRGSELEHVGDRNGVFRFDVVGGGGGSLAGGMRALRDVRVTWDVVLEGYNSKFTMLECEGKAEFVSGVEAWYTAEVPPPGCCSDDGVSGLVADVRLEMKEIRGGRMVVEKIGLGLLNIVGWRYVTVVDALKYLQHFLLVV